MKHLSFIYLFALSNIVAGQDVQKETFRKPKFQLGINVSPDVNFLNFKIHDPGSTFITKDILFDVYKKYSFGFSGGIHALYHFTNRFALQGGVQYAYRSYATNELDVRLIDGGRATLQSVERQEFIDIPLRANFRFGKGRVRFITGIGVTTNIYINRSAKVTYSNVSNPRTEVYYLDIENRIHFSPTISAGIDWQVSPKSCIRIEPTFMYRFTGDYYNTIQTLYYSAGLSMGWFFGL